MILIALAGLAAILLATYSPNDPSWLSATDQPVQNGLGRLGASVASPLYIILGLGSWSVVFVLGVWGARLMMHHGSERAISRLIFAPIGVAVIAVYASTLVPYAGWGHSCGLGGLLGDTVLGAVLGVAPVSAGLGLKIMSGLFGLGALWLGAFALGFTRPELKTGPAVYPFWSCGRLRLGHGGACRRDARSGLCHARAVVRLDRARRCGDWRARDRKSPNSWHSRWKSLRPSVHLAGFLVICREWCAARCRRTLLGLRRPATNAGRGRTNRRTHPRTHRQRDQIAGPPDASADCRCRVGTPRTTGDTGSTRGRTRWPNR